MMVGCSVEEKKLTKIFFFYLIYENIYEGNTMQQFSISDIQRNLHKLDDFDIVEIVDKKRDAVKGYFIDNKYAEFVKELIESEKKRHIQTQEIASSLHKYAQPSIFPEEEGAWKKQLLKKYEV